MIPETLALLLPLVFGADREVACGITFELPSGWTRRELPEKKSVALLAPGVSGTEECMVLFFPDQENDLGVAEFHDSVWKSISQGSQIVAKPAVGTKGLFQLTSARIQTVDGQPGWITLYTAKSGKHAGAMIFLANSEPLFKTHRPAVEQLLAGAALTATSGSQKAETVGGLVIPLPADWTREVDAASGSTVLKPPASRNPFDCRLFILPPQKLEGRTRWSAHRAVFDALVKSAQWTKVDVVTHSENAPGIFIQSDAVGTGPPGAPARLSMYSAADADRMEALVIVNSLSADYDIRAILLGSALKEPTRKPARPKILEVFRRIESKVYSNIDGTRSFGPLQYERIHLWSNGVADHRTSYEEGFAESGLPAKVDRNLLNGFFGSWEAAGKDVRIQTWADQPAKVYTRENGNLRFGDQVWKAMPRVDGLRLAGRWSMKSPAADPVPSSIWMDFTSDGRFSHDGALNHVHLPGDHPEPPRKGSGTYEIRDWTIWFRFDGGPTWSTDFSTLSDDVKDLSTILLRTHAFLKE